MSINQLFEISRRSLQANSAAMNTVGQNVANANTEGYSRRRITLGADNIASQGIYVRSRSGANGVGVSVQSYERVRDNLLGASSREARSALGSSEEEARILSALEGTFAVGSEGSLLDVMGDFWDAWSDVANNPTDQGVRSALLSKTDTLNSTLHRIDQDISRLQQETSTALTEGVDEVNSMLEKVAELNEAISHARASGAPDLAAEDERDQLLKDLSEFAPVQVQQDGEQYNVTFGGMTVVQGGETVELKLDTPSGGPTQIVFGDTGVAFSAPAGDDGKLGAWQRTLNDTLPGVRNQLDQFVEDLVEQVNNVHQSGYGLDGGTGRNFFDPAGTTASTIALSGDITDPDAIAAADAPNASGNSGAALDIAQLRETFDADAVNIITEVGTKVERANRASASNATVVAHLDGLERGVSGVSIDEEMTNMMQYQQAYAAAARVLNTAQEMMDTILAL